MNLPPSAKTAIKNFHSSALAFKAATKNLSGEIEKIVNNLDTVEELQDLIDCLPPSYIGCRRIYEKIERLHG